MSRVVVLDASAVDALATGSGSGTVRAALEAAERLGRDVVIPSVVLAELYRTRSKSQQVDALLSRQPGMVLRDTDRAMARLVGTLLAAARMDSAGIVDAHVVATAVEAGGGVCLTADPDDLERLSAGAASVVVEPVVSG